MLRHSGLHNPLFHSHPQPVWIHHAETLRFLAVNDAAVAKYGYSREEFLDMGAGDIAAPALPDEEPRGTLRHITRDGSILDVELASHRLEFAGYPAILVVANDVTEQKRAEETITKLNKSLESRIAELEALINVVPIGIAVAEDRECRRIQANRILSELLGLPAGANASVTAPTDEKPPYRLFSNGKELAPDELPMQIAAARGIEVPNVETDVLFDDGREMSFLTFSSPLFDEHGNPRGSVASFLDITRRKATENALREAKETFEAVIQASPLAIVAMDFGGNVKSWNRAAERIFGWEEEEVLNRPFPIVPDDDVEFFRTNVERARTGGTVAGVERKRRKKDGTLIDVGLWNAVQRDASGTPVGVISVMADITERKRLEEDLRQSQKMEAVGRLAGGVAHDFNNLMTVVTGFSRLVLDSLSPADPLRGHLEEILKAGDRAAMLTNQLLAFGRRQIIQPRVLDPNRIISDMERMLRRVIIEDIELVIKLDPALGKIKADRVQIEQIVMNLV
ncbi:MAG: PAS domain S-box protein, partial [Acidobacteria bacterium]|nr:PAS domain S-box protein [Acidobacteriota bacterium]